MIVLSRNADSGTIWAEGESESKDEATGQSRIHAEFAMKFDFCFYEHKLLETNINSIQVHVLTFIKLVGPYFQQRRKVSQNSMP